MAERKSDGSLFDGHWSMIDRWRPMYYIIYCLSNYCAHISYVFILCYTKFIWRVKGLYGTKKQTKKKKLPQKQCFYAIFIVRIDLKGKWWRRISWNCIYYLSGIPWVVYGWETNRRWNIKNNVARIKPFIKINKLCSFSVHLIDIAFRSFVFHPFLSVSQEFILYRA